MNQLWISTAIIVIGLVLGFYFQNRQIGDLRSEMNARINDLRSEMNARFAAIDKRFDDLKDLFRSEVKRLEDRMERLEHPVHLGPRQ